MDRAWLQANVQNCVTVLLCYCVTVSPERSGNNSRKKNYDRITYKYAYSALQVITTDGNVMRNMEHYPPETVSGRSRRWGRGEQRGQCCIDITFYLGPQFSNPEQPQSLQEYLAVNICKFMGRSWCCVIDTYPECGGGWFLQIAGVSVMSHTTSDCNRR